MVNTISGLFCGAGGPGQRVDLANAFVGVDLYRDQPARGGWSDELSADSCAVESDGELAAFDGEIFNILEGQVRADGLAIGAGGFAESDLFECDHASRRVDTKSERAARK